MAISNYSDWSFACTNCGRKTFTFIPTTHESVPSLTRVSSSSKLLRSLVVKSSGFPPSTLQEQSLVTDLALNAEETRMPDAENANDLLRKLFQEHQTQQQQQQLAYNYYQKAKESPEFKPEKATMNQLIRYLINAKKWGSISSISEDFRVYNVMPDSKTCRDLIRSCIKARKFKTVESVLRVFESDAEISVLAYDVAMRGYNKLHMYRSTISLHERMKSARIAPDYECYGRIMEAHMKIGEFEKVVTLFEQIESRRKLDSVTLPYPSRIYAILCESFGKLGRAFEALEFFREMMRERGSLEDHSIYGSLICTFASIKEVKVAEELFSEALEKKMLRDPAVFLKLVLMYVEQGSVEKTLEVVKAMKAARIGVSDCIFCAIVNGYCKSRELSDAVKIYEELIMQGCEPGQVTCASMINIYCRLGLYAKAEEIFFEMEQKGYDKCVVAYSSMVVMYGKTGRLKDAMRLVAKMKERKCNPNVWIYNSLMEMHGKVENLRQVDKLWKEMKRRKVVADKVSYTTIISAYSKAREYEACVEFYHEFRINGGMLDRAMAGIMVGIFSKIGRVDELVKILQDMKLEGTGLDDRLYWSALNALRDAGLPMQAKWLQESFKASKIINT